MLLNLDLLPDKPPGIITKKLDLSLLPDKPPTIKLNLDLLPDKPPQLTPSEKYARAITQSITPQPVAPAPVPFIPEDISGIIPTRPRIPASVREPQLRVPMGELIDKTGMPSLQWTAPKRETELRHATQEKENLFTKAKRFIQKPFIKTSEEQIAHSQNVYALSKLMPNIPITSIDENFADIIRMPEVIEKTGIRPEPRLKDIGEKAITGMIVARILTNPVATAMTVGGFTALNEADNYITSKIKDKEYRFGTGEKALSLLLPDQANEITKDTLDIIDFLGKGAILGGMYKIAPKYAERLTKITVEKYNMPKRIFISPEKVRSIFQTGEGISPQEQDLIQSLGLSGTQYREAINKGINIEIPTEKIITITDKPYWAKIKGLFNIKSFEKIKTTLVGKPREIVGQIEAKPEVKPTVPEVKPIEPIRELKEFEIVDGKRIPVYETKPIIPEMPKVVEPTKIPKAKEYNAIPLLDNPKLAIEHLEYQLRMDNTLSQLSGKPYKPVITNLQGKLPETLIVYRATQKGENDILPFTYVTASKKTALDWIAGHPERKLISKTVSIKDLAFDPAGIREEGFIYKPVEPTKEVAPSVAEVPFDYQDTHQENLAKTGFASGDTSAQFEAGGDIFRELTNETPDLSYIKEKANSINRYWKRFDIRKDTENLSLLRKYWEGQPTETPEQQLAKDLNLAIIDRNKDSVDNILKKIQTPAITPPVVEPAKPEVIKPKEAWEMTREKVKDYLLKNKDTGFFINALNYLKEKERLPFEALQELEKQGKLRKEIKNVNDLVDELYNKTFNAKKRNYEDMVSIIKDNISELKNMISWQTIMRGEITDYQKSADWLSNLYGEKILKEMSIKEGILKALSEGKLVPAEVLKDYPELQKEVKPELFNNQQIARELTNMGVEIIGDKVKLYRGGNVSPAKLRQLRYGDFLSTVREGKDIVGNAGASEYGKTIIEIELPIKDIQITNGEIQYKGISKSLESGTKYTQEIYKAANNVWGSNYTAKEIDKMSFNEVFENARMGLSGGKKEFINLMKSEGKTVPPEVLKDYPELQKEVKPAEVKKVPKERKPRRLWQEINRFGGTNTRGWEAAGFSLKDKYHKGLLWKTIRREGLSPDVITESLIGADIIPPIPTEFEGRGDEYLFSLLEKESSGEPVTFQQKELAMEEEMPSRPFETISETELELGDKFKIDDEKFKVKQKEPKVIIEDGYKKTLTDFETIEIDEGSLVKAELVAVEKRGISDRYNIYKKQAIQSGLSETEANKFAIKKLEQEKIAQKPKEEITKPKQVELGAAGGIEGFGKGAKGEQELPITPIGKPKGKIISGTGFAKPIEIDEGGLEKIKENDVYPNAPSDFQPNIEMPELYKLAKELMGKPPLVARLRTKLGLFKSLEGIPISQIKITPEAFKNPIEANKILAHEIGHLIDWLPDFTLKRGNLIGRLRTLKNFLSSTFGEDKALNLSQLRNQATFEVLKSNNIKFADYIKDKNIREKYKGEINKNYQNLIIEKATLINRDIKKELVNISKYWHPYDESKVDTTYIAYRLKSRELYAEAISVLFNQPGKLKEIAPVFYKTFWENIDKKPDVDEALKELYKFIGQDYGEILKQRQLDIRDMFEKSEKRFFEIRNEEKAKDKSLWFRIKDELIDKNITLLDKVKELKTKGIKLNPEDNPKYYMSEHNYIGGKLKNILEDVNDKVLLPSQELGISEADLGEYLFLKRVTTERGDIANPLGQNRITAQKQLDFLMNNLKSEQQQALEQAVSNLKELVKNLNNEANKVGLYKSEIYKQIITNENYAPFQVLDYLNDYITPKVIHQVGTFKEIANPMTSSILKMISLKRAIERQKIRAKTVDFLKNNYSNEIEEAEYRQLGKVREIKDKEGFGIIPVYEQGIFKGYYVDPYIADSLNYQPQPLNNAVLSTIRFLNSNWFRPVYVNLNLGFQTFNLLRDLVRGWKLNPNLKFYEIVGQYIKAYPVAKQRIFGIKTNEETSKLLRDMQESGALSISYNDLLKGADEELTQAQSLLTRYKILGNENKKGFWKGFLEKIEDSGNIIETLPKVVGYKTRLRKLSPQYPIQEIAYETRVYSGSPDFLRKGRGYRWYNNVFLFSNAIKEGIRGDFEGAFKNPRTRSGYWFKTTAINILPKILMFLGLAGYLGKKIEDNYEKQTEFDKTNYITIPLGDTKDGQAIYLRIPQDEVGRILGGVFWKGINTDKNVLKSFGEITNITAGQLPSISPEIEMLSTNMQYLSGQNPYDFFRGRTILTRDEQIARGWYGLKKMGMWNLSKLGLDSSWSYKTKNDEATFVKIIRHIPIISRFIKITDYGMKEKEREEKEEITIQKAKIRLERGTKKSTGGLRELTEFKELKELQ